MLQIKKKGQLICCKYNLLFLFRRPKPSYEYQVRRQVGHSITLRAPKHFNIGKNKILNLNYKTPTLFLRKKYPLFIDSLSSDTYSLFLLLHKRIKTTPALKVNSIRVRVLTKFTIRWLEI